MRNEVRFYRRGRLVARDDLAPATTLLDYLRLDERATGTKEGCAEGDCGACTVVLRRLRAGKIVYEPVNACILLAGQVDGSEVIAVEDLADGALHPVQQTLVDHHGSQCGFCTPGFVMSLFALYHDAGAVDRNRALDAISGNLCRCTGYRPIVDAALTSCRGKREDRFSREDGEAVRRLAMLDDGTDVFVGTPERFFAAPASIESLAKLYLEHSDATLVAGATDVGLWITKELRELKKIIWLGRVAGLDRIEREGNSLRIGATATIEQAREALTAIDSDIGEMIRRFAGRPIRTCATVGGNIANGSPIGDTPPILIALGATLELQRGDKVRTNPLEDFFLDYKKQDRAKGEFVRAVIVPALGKNEHFRAFKISKRYEQDISAVMAALKLKLDGRKISDACVAFGGMAATPKRAKAVEHALRGLDLDGRTAIDKALAALGDDFKPIDDMRASARYRLNAARAVLRKAILEIAGAPSNATRVFGRREWDHAATL